MQGDKPECTVSATPDLMNRLLCGVDKFKRDKMLKIKNDIQYHEEKIEQLMQELYVYERHTV